MTNKTETAAEQTTPTRYRVTAPYITCRLVETGFFVDPRKQIQVFGYYAGGILPVNADPVMVKSLLAKGFIEEAVPA